MSNDSTPMTSESDANATKHEKLGFYPAPMIHYSLPYQQPKDAAGSPVTVWKRFNGSYGLSMQAGPMKIPGQPGVEYMLPYGKYARLALYYLCTEAVKNQSPTIELAMSYRGFMKDLGVPWDSKTAQAAVKQLRALLAMRLDSFSTRVDEDGAVLERQISCTVGTDVEIAFVQDGNIDKRRSYFVLSQEFYNQVIEHFSVPLGNKVWAELVKSTKSPLTLDAYLWLHARLFEGGQRSITRPVRITWDQLANQFGSTAQQKEWRKSFVKSLGEIGEVAPELAARVEVKSARGKGSGHCGIVLKPAPRCLRG